MSENLQFIMLKTSTNPVINNFNIDETNGPGSVTGHSKIVIKAGTCSYNVFYKGVLLKGI